jgi:hypothetical protein
MNKQELLGHLERLDAALVSDAVLCVYGSGAFILMDEPDRSSLDLDVAGPYSRVNFADLQRAAREAGFPVNPDEATQGDHIEWVSAARLCLPKPDPETEIVLWQGKRLSIRTVPVPQLIASKLIRYDAIDQGDIQYVCACGRVDFLAVRKAVRQLPVPFNRDSLVLENLENLRQDLKQWRKGKL